MSAKKLTPAQIVLAEVVSKEEASKVETAPAPRLDDLNQPILIHNDVVSEDLIPGSKLVAYYLDEGYALLPYKTRFKDEAVKKAVSVRQEGLLSAYVVLKKGWYGVFTKTAEAREAKAKKVESEKRVVPVEVDGHHFESTKLAREFARRILDAARAAEDEI